MNNDNKQNEYTIGAKIRDLRLKNGLTQEELADRAELSKGFISQLENDLTSPSIATLIDILTLLGTTLSAFFSDSGDEQIVFGADDFFVSDYNGTKTTWIVPTAQKNMMEPITVELEPGAKTDDDFPHEGEEFGLVLSGEITLCVGNRSEVVHEGETFYFSSDRKHYIINSGKTPCKVVWVSCPPSF
ncbi:MAG: helix-turn-helix transcriptional regulator [Clostridiales bacterium]|nr:helix-turn-helix transcriptional regulator [Clostridiales bacterium]